MLHSLSYAPSGRARPRDTAGASAASSSCLDHVHFFCVCDEAQGGKSLSDFVGGFKQWTAKAILRNSGLPAPLWQSEFFDHLLRSDESYGSKWTYVRENPVRAGLAQSPEDWPYAGEIAPIMR